MTQMIGGGGGSEFDAFAAVGRFISINFNAFSLELVYRAP